MGLFGPRNADDGDNDGDGGGQMELVEHLAELRNRIFRALLFLFAGMGVAWFLYGPIETILNHPIQPILARVKGQTVFTTIQDGFLLQLQVSLITGLILAAPFIIFELWGFIKPALTETERKPVYVLAPLSVLLFAAGVVTAYAALPAAYGWMASYVLKVPDAALLQNAKDYVLLTAKILLAFGLSFELPVVLLFLAKIGVLTAKVMTTYWRHAVVIIAGLAAVFAPSNEPVTMLLMAVPMVVLYLASIGMVRAMEPNPDGTARNAFWGMLLIFLAPSLILAAASFWLWKTNYVPPSPLLVRPTSPGMNAEQTQVLTRRVIALEKKLGELEAREAKRSKKTAPAPSPAPRANAKGR